MKELKVAIVGYGGIARSHKTAYDLLAKENFPIRLVALCDIDPKQFEKDITINIESGEESGIAHLHRYTSIDELLKNEDFDVADVCVPTYAHKECTLRLLNAGKHVQCEKPMALCAADCQEMLAAAEKAGRKLMIGQVLRFQEPYISTKKLLDSGKVGRVLQIHMERLCALPLWGYENWFTDYRRSGGSVHDLGIHDYDMLRYLFGNPSEVSAVAVAHDDKYQYVSGRLFYPNGMLATVSSSWLESNTAPFYCGFRIAAEGATIVWDLRTPARVYPKDGEPHDLEVARGLFPMAEEIRFFANSILNGTPLDKNDPYSSMQSVALIEKLRESADRGGEKIAF